MAAIEEKAKLEPAINGSRMKNVAKKSTTRPPGDVARLRSSPPKERKDRDVPSTTTPRSAHSITENTPILEKLAMGINGQNRQLTEKAASLESSLSSPKESTVGNGNSGSESKKRPADSDSSDSDDNPAKLARTQIANMERKQEEMLATAMSVDRTETVVSKGDASRPTNSSLKTVNIPTRLLNKDSNHHSSSSSSQSSDHEGNVEPDSSADAKSESLADRSLFSISHKMKDSFKGIIQAAVTNVTLDSSANQCTVNSDSDAEMSKTDQVSSTTAKATSLSETRTSGKSNLFESLSNLSPFGPLVNHFKANKTKKGVTSGASDNEDSRSGKEKENQDGGEKKIVSEKSKEGAQAGSSSVISKSELSETEQAKENDVISQSDCSNPAQSEDLDEVVLIGDQEEDENDVEEIDLSLLDEPSQQDAAGTSHQSGDSDTGLDANHQANLSESITPLSDDTQKKDKSEDEPDEDSCKEVNGSSGTDGNSKAPSELECDTATPGSEIAPTDNKEDSAPIVTEELYIIEEDEVVKESSDKDALTKADSDESDASQRQSPEGNNDKALEKSEDSFEDDGNNKKELNGMVDGETDKELVEIKEPNEEPKVEDEDVNSGDTNSNSSEKVSKLESSEDAKSPAVKEEYNNEECKNQDVTQTEDKKSDVLAQPLGEVKQDSEEEPSKKRSLAENSQASTKNAKRCRLDALIGRLGSQIEPKKETDLHNVSSDSVITTSSTTLTAEEASSATSAAPSGSDQVITLTVKELQKLIARRCSEYLQSAHGSLITDLQKRIDAVNSENEEWRTKARDMQSKILELTIMQQRQSRRVKAISSGTTRNMSVQVDEAKIQAAVSNMVQPLTSGSPAGKAATAAPSPAQKSSQSHAQQPQQPPQQAVIGTLVAPVASGPGALPLGGGTITLLSPNTLPPASANISAQIRFATKPTGQTTVREMLTKREQDEPTSSTPRSSQSARATSSLVTRGVIDLTEESEGGASKQGKLIQGGSTQVVAAVPTSTQTVVAPALAVQPAAQLAAGTTQLATAGIRPTTTLLVQQGPATAPAVTGAQLLLQPVGSQGLPAAPTGATLLYTSRPGTFVVQTTPSMSTSIIRPVTASPSTAAIFQPPAATACTAVVATVTQTKPAAPTTTTATVVARPPPPLKPAPGVQHSKLAPAPLQPKQQQQASQVKVHPAPLPSVPTNKVNPAWKLSPPRPGLKISRVQQGIVLSWNMSVTDAYAEIVNYQLFAYQETSAPPSANLWKKVGDVKALPLPMACTLTQFQEGNKYHFSVRAVDTHGRIGAFSSPTTIHLEAAS